MAQSTKYLTIVCSMLELYQVQLLNTFRRMGSMPVMVSFQEQFNSQFKKMKEIEVEKSIESQRCSEICEAMSSFLSTQHRVKKTSQSERYSRGGLRSQEATRMKFSTGFKKQEGSGLAEIDEIVNSYRIKAENEPKLRMKWKALEENEKSFEQKSSTIGHNNIDLLSYTIPQIENSIKRLSVQAKNNRGKATSYDFDAYRTVDTRSHNRKKYVPRLF